MAAQPLDPFGAPLANAAPPAPPAARTAPAKGFSIFGYHPSLPNLGGITAVKQLASGFLGLPEQVYRAANDVSTGDWHDLSPLNPTGVIGNFETGIGMGVEDLATSATGLVGIPGTKYNLGDQVISPLLSKLNEFGPQSPQAAGFKPQTFWTRKGGPIAGAVQDLSIAAMVAAPFASAAAGAAATAGTAAETAGTAATAAEAAAAAGEGTVEAATAARAAAAATSARAAELAQRAGTLKNVAHPYQYLGARGADLLAAAQDAARPAALADAGGIPAVEAPPVADLKSEGGVKRPNVLSKAGRIVQAEPPTTAANAALLDAAGLGAQDTVRLYHGQELPGSGPESPFWSTSPQRAKSYGPVQFSTEVPRSVYEEMKQATQSGPIAEDIKNGKINAQLNPTKDVVIDPQNPAHEQWAQAAHQWDRELGYSTEPHQPLSMDEINRGQHTPGEVAPGREGKMVAHEPVRPAQAVAEGSQAVSDAETAARAGVAQPNIADAMGRILDRPTPAWATRAIEGVGKVPVVGESVVKDLASLGGKLDKSRLLRVARGYGQLAEIARVTAERSDFVTQSSGAIAKLIEAAGVDRETASRMVGEEFTARYTGRELAAQATRDGMPAEIAANLYDVARADAPGITPEVWAKLGAERAGVVEEHLGLMQDGYRKLSQDTYEKLLASPGKGGKALEGVILNDKGIPLTGKQQAIYNEAMRHIRTAYDVRTMEGELGKQMATASVQQLKGILSDIQKDGRFQGQGSPELVHSMENLLGARQVEDAARGRLAKLGKALDESDVNSWPREYRPLGRAFESMQESAQTHPEWGQYMGEIPKTFSQVMAYASAHGFEPRYVTESMTWEQAQRTLFGHMQIGGADPGTLGEAGLRKTNTGAMTKQGMHNFNVETLVAANAAATKELYSNMLVNFVEQHWAREWNGEAGPIPDGWEPWDPTRQRIMATKGGASGDLRAPSTTMIVPESVNRGLNGMSKQYDHWTFHTLSRVTKPWVTYNLSLSPRWYLHVTISNIVRGLSEGVSFKEYWNAAKAWKGGTLPNEVFAHSIAQMTAEGGHSLFGMTVKQAKETEGMKSAIREVQSRMRKVHDVVDQITRHAVYEHTLATGASREAAIQRMYEAGVDYGNLSNFERQAVRSVIPFYPFYKGMVKLLARFPADHPVATAVLWQMGRMHDEELKSRFGGQIPDAYRGTADIFGMHNFTVLDPFITPTHLIDIHSLSSVLNPYVDVMLRDAYNAAQPGTGTPGITATGQRVSQVDVAKALGSQFAGASPTRVVQQAATGSDIFGTKQGVAGAVGQFLGAPQPIDAAAIAARVRKATSGPAPKRAKAVRVKKPGRLKAGRSVRVHKMRARRITAAVRRSTKAVGGI